MKIYYASSAEINPDWKSKDIMHFLGCNWSHVLHIIEPDNGEAYIWHSTGEGVNRMLLNQFLKTHVLIHKFDVTDRITSHIERFLGYLEGSNGKDYSETQYAGFIPAVESIKNWFKSKVDDNESELICSEFTARTANLYTNLVIKGDEDFIDPKNFIEQLQAYGLKNLVG